MPKLPLTDHDVAHVLTFVYSSFGNSGKEVMPQEVSTARAEKDAVALNQPNGKTPPEPKSGWE